MELEIAGKDEYHCFIQTKREVKNNHASDDVTVKTIKEQEA